MPVVDPQPLHKPMCIVKPVLSEPIVMKPQTNTVFDGTTKRIAFNPRANS